MQPVTVPTLVVDGDCGFCTRTAMWVERHARTPVEIVAHQDLDDRRLDAFRLSPMEVAEAVWWIGPSGQAERGSLAIGRSLIACGIGWQALGWLAIVPPTRWIAAALYPVLVRFRHRLPGAGGTCAVRTGR